MSNQPEELSKITPEEKISQIKEFFSLKEKELFVPPIGLKMQIGPYVYKVKITNPSQLRFTAELFDVPIPGEKETSNLILPPEKKIIQVVKK